MSSGRLCARDDRHTQLRILVADPNEDTRELYRELLRLAGGYDVVEATDGRDALIKALAHRPALVITETRLPVFDGYALCAVLRRDSTTRTTPILVVTTEARHVDLERARAAGGDAVLVKPVSPDALLMEIRRLIGGPAESGDTSATPSSSGAVAGKTHPRFETTTPPASPPDLICPSCDRPLTYERSHIGGVSSRHPEQWDEYACPTSCGTFEYRQRTRKVRRLGEKKRRH